MADATVRNATTNQITVDYQKKRLSLFDGDTIRKDYANISGAIESAEVGTIMGIVDATQKVVPCQSDATDGSQEPKAILFGQLSEIAIAGEVDNILLLNSGEVNTGLLLFAKSGDTLATVITTTGGDKMTIGDALIKNCKSLKLVEVSDSSEFDN